jgi:hypothetical protein
MKSWKTTLTGIMQFIIIAWGQLQFLIDADEMTNPDYGLVFTSFVVLIGLVSASDNNVTSKEATA